MRIKKEIQKCLHNRIIAVILMVSSFLILFFQFYYGEFGKYLVTDSAYIANVDDKVLTGEKAYFVNKNQCEKYAGFLTDALLDKLHNDYKNIEVSDDGYLGSNMPFRQFKKVFLIDTKNYRTVSEVIKTKSKIKYGFTSDWENLYKILDKCFLILMIISLFLGAIMLSEEKEIGMNQIINSSSKGKYLFFKDKYLANAGILNVIFLVVISWVVIIHFYNVGFTGKDIGIQCLYDFKYAGAEINCTVFNYMLMKIIAGVIGINGQFIIGVFISAYSSNNVKSIERALMCAFILFNGWVKAMRLPSIVFIFEGLFPINSIDIGTLIISELRYEQIVLIYIIEIFALFLVIKKAAIKWSES